MEKGKLPDFRYEKRLMRRGYKYIAGVDEVGRGSFAGPLVTGCVILPIGVGVLPRRSPTALLPASKRGAPSVVPPAASHPSITSEAILINDSKKMRPKQREAADKWIRENCLAWGIGEVSVQKINSLGMGKAAKIAFRKAISEARKRLGKPIDFLVSDAFFIPYVPGLPARRRKNRKGRYYKKTGGRQLAIVKGDGKSISIAAASVIAKVYRDKLMTVLSKKPKYKKYGWGRNKGYGTRGHQTAIKKYGITRQHRHAFVSTWLGKNQ